MLEGDGSREFKAKGMIRQSFYRVAERAREKRESRARDMQRIASGEISPAELNDKNGFFSCLDARRARLVNPRVRIQIADDQ